MFYGGENTQGFDFAVEPGNLMLTEFYINEVNKRSDEVCHGKHIA